MFEMPYSAPAPESQALGELLWAIVSEETQGMDIRQGCEELLKNFIANGVQRMQAEKRTGRGDLQRAESSLRLFLEQMKMEAMQRGHPGWIGEDTFYPALDHFQTGAGKRFRFALWPFWPL